MIPQGMFSGWLNLKYLNLGDVQEIGNEAFMGCNALTSLVLPETVRKVGEIAFSAQSLESVEIRSERVVFDESFSIGGDVSVLIANTVLSATGRFVWLSSGDALNHNLSFTFEEGSRLEEFGIAARSTINSISLPPSVKRLTEGAFYSCGSLRSIVLPESLEYIGEGAFELCSDLRRVAIPEKVDTIERNAFAGCSKLYEISIPENTSLRYIGEWAFSSGPDLEPFVLRGSESLTLGGTVWNFTELTVGKRVKRLIGPEPVCLGEYYHADRLYYSGITTFKVESGSALEEISGDLFARNAAVSLPSTMKVIGDFTFHGFTGTLNADFSNVTTIGGRAFESYDFGGEANFPAIVSIGARAFANAKCSNLGLGKAETVGGEAFRDMDGSITADFTKVTSFGTPYESFGSNVLKDVFTGVTGTINANLGDMAPGVWEWGYHANNVSVFSGYTGTLNASFASGGTIAPYAFFGYAGSLTGDFSNVVSIGDQAFLDFPGTFIGEMDLKSAVSVGVSAFSNFTGKITGRFPKVKTIGSCAFAGTSVKNATFGPDLESTGEALFNENVLEEVHFQGMTPPAQSDGWWLQIPKETVRIYVPASAYQSYKNAWGSRPWWSQVQTE